MTHTTITHSKHNKNGKLTSVSQGTVGDQSSHCKKVLFILTIVWSPQLQSVCVCVTLEVQEVLIIQIRVWLRSFFIINPFIHK